MAYGFVAFHYPRPDCFAEFVDRTHQVEAALGASPGCLSVEVWATPDGDAVVSTGRFTSEDAFRAAFAQVRDLDAVVYDDRERKPRQIIPLEPR